MNFQFDALFEFALEILLKNVIEIILTIVFKILLENFKFEVVSEVQIANTISSLFLVHLILNLEPRL